MFAKSMLFSALLAVATMTQAAVPGEIIAAYQSQSPSAWAVVSPDGSNLTYLRCMGDPTRIGTPRFFVGPGGGGKVLHTYTEADGDIVADRWSRELVVADEDCVESVILSNEGNKAIADARWSPDGNMIAIAAEEYDPALNTMVHSGIYLADVGYTGSRPTSISSFRQVVEANGSTGLDWSPLGGEIVYSDGGDLFTYNIGTGVAKRITNTPGRSEQGPTWSSRGRIAYQRVSEPSRSGDRIDIFSIPESGGAELRITSKSTTGATVNVSACYSPEGDYISFSSGGYPTLNEPGGGRALYKIKADGTGKAIKILGAKGQSWHFNRWRR
jgi:Tol biopolymer transport system component